MSVNILFYKTVKGKSCKGEENMKKITVLIMVMMLLLSTAAYASKEEYEILPYENAVSRDGMFEYVPNSGVITAYYGGEIVEIPNEIDGTKIKEVGVNVCFDLGISTVYIQDGIEIINESAFEGSNVFDVTIPSSVTYIGDKAFANCSELVTVTLNSENINFGDEVFANTTYMQFMVPCTIDTEKLREKLIAAKGADNFEFVEIHNNLVESMEEKDIYGESVFYCEDCGFNGSKYIEAFDNVFDDVSSDSWYCTYVQMANNLGIMVGKSDTLFDPNAGMTLAEAATIAARIREEQYHEHTAFEPVGEHWYDVYVDYCYRNGIIEEGITFDWDKKATRAEMAYLFSRCDLSDYYINEVPITDIPDVNDGTLYSSEILELYNKGIAVGSDEYLTYYPDASVRRCEVAAIVARIMYTDMRIELPKG